MLTKEDCQKLAEQYLKSWTDVSPNNEGYCILDEETERIEFGWSFFWTSKSYLETGEPPNRLIGSGPILVDELNGNVMTLPSVYLISGREGFINEYLIQNHAKRINWSIDKSSLPLQEIGQLKWLNAIRAVFDCNQDEAQQFLNELHKVKFTKIEDVNRLKSELLLRGIREVKINKTVVDVV